nr:PREDICTED: uncharacterized protein LOC105663302 [Megachile rotundata]
MANEGANPRLGDAGASSSDEVSVVSQNLRIPQFWPLKVALWFKLLKAHFTSARITKDETKFNITIANLGEKYIEQVEDIAVDSPESGQYELLKKELMKRLTESDSTRVRKLLEGEEIGDRTPSQFFRDLKKLGTSSVPDDFIVTLWKNRLPTNTQRVLAAATETNITALTEMADRIHEIRPERGHLASVSRDNEVMELWEEIQKLRLQLSEVTQRQGRPRKPQRRRSGSEAVAVMEVPAGVDYAGITGNLRRGPRDAKLYVPGYHRRETRRAVGECGTLRRSSDPSHFCYR